MVDYMNQKFAVLVTALRDIANLEESDCAKYVAKADDIACEALAEKV